MWSFFVLLSALVECNNFLSIAKHQKTPEEIPEWEFITILALIVTLVLLGGLVAGLTIGLMSIDATNLAILKVSGTPSEKYCAAKIEPIRKNGHLLLVTLLLVNTIVNETLPILFDALNFHGVAAVLSSTALIVVFGEILPQAVCSRYGLQIGAFFAFPVRILIFLMSIVAYPIAKLLDWLLGHQEGNIYRHAGLKELVALHGEDQEGPLSKDEVSILRAVLDLRSKTVKDVMTPVDDVFMFSIAQKLNRENIQKIISAGHSRIPIYLGNDRNAILGTLLVKQLLLNDPDDETPLSSIKLRKLPRVCADTPLFDMLHVFEAGASHMALIIDDLSESSGLDRLNSMTSGIDSPRWLARNDHSKFKCLGIITLEDVIEELIGEEIIDETDVYVDMQTKTKVLRQTRPGSRTTPLFPVFSNDEEGSERTPVETDALLGNPQPSQINPNSALYFRPIQLPISTILSPTRASPSSKKSPELQHLPKRGKKTMFDPKELMSDLYSESSISLTADSALQTPFTTEREHMDLATVPELELSKPSLAIDIEAPNDDDL